MTERERLIELLMRGEREAENIGFFNCRKSEKKTEYIADFLFENGVVLVDTNCVKRENLPLIQQAFSMPLDELAKIVEKHTAQNGLAYVTPNFELLEG